MKTHFIIFQDAGIPVEDWALQDIFSPKLSPDFGLFPHTGWVTCAVLYPDEMKVIFRKNDEKHLIQWHFDEKTVVQLDPKFDDVVIRDHGICASVKPGKIFIYGGQGSKRI